MIDNLKNMGSGKTIEVKINKIASMACRAAVKANDYLTEIEMKELIEQLRKVYDKVDMNIYNSTKNVNLNTIISYVQDGKVHHFMDNY